MTHQHNESTVGVFTQLREAERSVEDLKRAGFAQDEIGIVGNVSPDDAALPMAASAQAPEYNVTEGVLAGGLAGAIVGFVVLLAIPGLGEVSGFGRWFEWVGGLLVGGAVGGFLFAFVGLFLSRRRAYYLRQQLDKGRYIVTVRSPDRKQEAANVLRRRGYFVENVDGR